MAPCVGIGGTGYLPWEPLTTPLLTFQAILIFIFYYFSWKITFCFCPLADKTVLLLFIFDVDHVLRSLLIFYNIASVLCFGVFGPKACGILPPQLGIEPTPTAFQGDVLTTEPPAKSLKRSSENTSSQSSLPHPAHGGSSQSSPWLQGPLVVCPLSPSPCLTCFLASGHRDLAPLGICQAHSPPEAFTSVFICLFFQRVTRK